VLNDGDMGTRGKTPEAETPCEDRSGYRKVACVVITIEVTIRHKFSRNIHITSAYDSAGVGSPSVSATRNIGVRHQVRHQSSQLVDPKWQRNLVGSRKSFEYLNGSQIWFSVKYPRMSIINLSSNPSLLFSVLLVFHEKLSLARQLVRRGIDRVALERVGVSDASSLQY
jgi:hypothetical protein